MSTLDKYLSSLVGFFSYSRDDDGGSRGALSKLRDTIQDELSAQLGRAPKNFRIWQDKAAIPVGVDWEREIRQGISQSVFFIPIITPRVFRSENCAFEFESFLTREKELGRSDLVFPILYIPVPELEDETVWRQDPVLRIVGTRQYYDWRNLRLRDPGSTEVALNVERFCNNIANALRQPWESPEERQQREQAQAQRVAEQEQRFKTAELEVARIAEERIRRQQAEAAQLAQEQQQVRDAQTAQRAANEARAKIAEQGAKQRIHELAFNAARSANTTAALDAFLAGNPDSRFAAEAAVLKGELQAREQAHRQAMAGNDPSSLQAFCDTYKTGGDVATARKRLRALVARPHRSLPRSATVGAGALAAVLLLGILIWAVNRPRPNIDGSHQVAAPSASPANPSRAAIAAATPLNLEKWSFCAPNATQQPNYVGGPAEPATLKIASTPAQQLDAAVRAIAISPDGKTLATAGDDHVIRVWDASSLKWLREIRAHTAQVYSLDFSVDGNLLASASFDGTVRVWNAHTFALMRLFKAEDDKGPVKLYDAAFEPLSNPQYVDAVGADGAVRIWDLRSGQLVGEPRVSSGNGVPAASLSFAPDESGTFVTANFDGTIKFFEPGRIDAIPAFPNKALRVVYSPDGKLVASAGVDDASNRTVRLWNATSHTLSTSFAGHRHSAVSVAWSPDGKRLVTGGGYKDLTVRLWDAQSGRQLGQPFTGHRADVEAVAFHPNRRWLISASEDGTIKLWDIPSGRELLSVIGFADGQYLAYAPNGCYTGSANAPNYVRYVVKDADGHERDTGDNGRSSMFVPGDSTALLLPQ